MVYAQPRIDPGEWDTQSSLGFRDTNRSPNLFWVMELNAFEQSMNSCVV